MRWRDVSPGAALPPWPSERQRPAETGRLGTPHADAQATPWIAVRNSVLADVRSHVGARAVEQGGLLLGSAHGSDSCDAGAPTHIVVVEAVAAPGGEASAIALRMDTDVWRRAAARLDALRGADSAIRVIGWYHSHPGLGAFFSATDRRTQRAFFAHAYSLGWVVDPVADDHAFFLGRDALPVTACVVN